VGRVRAFLWERLQSRRSCCFDAGVIAAEATPTTAGSARWAGSAHFLWERLQSRSIKPQTIIVMDEVRVPIRLVHRTFHQSCAHRVGNDVAGDLVDRFVLTQRMVMKTLSPERFVR
jgi:hypothetical protein